MTTYYFFQRIAVDLEVALAHHGGDAELLPESLSGTLVQSLVFLCA